MNKVPQRAIFSGIVIFVKVCKKKCLHKMVEITTAWMYLLKNVSCKSYNNKINCSNCLRKYKTLYLLLNLINLLHSKFWCYLPDMNCWNGLQIPRCLELLTLSNFQLVTTSTTEVSCALSCEFFLPKFLGKCFFFFDRAVL